MSNPIICALDTSDLNKAVSLASDIQGSVGAMKLGLEFFIANGPQGVAKIKETGMPIFLDLKLHDIPNTVAGAVRSAVSIGVDMLTLHSSGGQDMMKRAVEAAVDTSEKTGNTLPLILGVTVLTSMDIGDLNHTLNTEKENVKDHVLHLASITQSSGVGGCVCSPHEIEPIRSHIGNELKLVVPGVRRKEDAQNDQKRVMTPAEAIQKGADYLVIGRPITQADSPSEAANAILEEINQAR